MKTRILATVSLLTLLTATSVLAQPPSLRANVPFEFTVGAKALPAGQYQITRLAGDASIRITAVEKGPAAVATVITRLWGGIHTSPQDAHLVFDQVGDTSFLSEIWIPGMDGFPVHSTKGKHEHRTVDIPR
jgi:hypothetical protein